MTVQTTIAFATFLLEYKNLVTFHEGTFHLANNFRSFYGRSTNFNVTVGINQENLIEID